MYSTALCAQSCCSSALIGRDALAKSVSPAQKRLKPPPVPDCATATCTLPPCSRENSSATAVVMGNTVLEPSPVIVPVSVPSAAFDWLPPPPQAASPTSNSVPPRHVIVCLVFMCDPD